MPAYRGKSKILVCRYIMAWEKFQYAGISWHEKSFSMSVYHGMRKVSVCQHIMAWAKFQYADISGHRSKSPITVYFGSPAYQGIYQYLISPFISAWAFYNSFSYRQFWLSNISRHRSQS
jgi:hypothetical protein